MFFCPFNTYPVNMCTNPSSLHQLLTLEPCTNHWPLHWTLVVMLMASNPCTDPLQRCAMHQTLTRNPCSDVTCIKSLQGTLPVAHYTAQNCMEHKARGWCKCQGVGARVDMGVTGWTWLVHVTIASGYNWLTLSCSHHPLRSLLRLSHLHYVIHVGLTQPSTALTQLSYSYYLSYARHYWHSLDSCYVSPSYIRTLARYIRTL
jgi:hypothetical protein